MKMKLKKTAVFIGMLIGFAAAVQAQSATWDGGGTNSFWNTGVNWNPNGVPVPAVDFDLRFGGTVRLNSNNDFTDGSNFRNITFNNTAGAFILSGNAITLNGGITNNDANTQTINLDMAFPGIQTVNAASGNIVLGGSISGRAGG